MAKLTEDQLSEVAALDSFADRPPEVSLEVWSAAGAKYRRRCSRGVSQAQNICPGVQLRVNAGESLE